jgi:hypothetical protein
MPEAADACDCLLVCIQHELAQPKGTGGPQEQPWLQANISTRAQVKHEYLQLTLR